MRAPQRPGGRAMTTTRRDFLQTTGGALAGLAFVGCELMAAAPARAQGRRREVVVSGKRAKTVDVHAHCAVPEALALMNLKLGGPLYRPDLDMATEVSTRLRAMDEQGIDVEALSINPNWYTADRDLARQIIKLQNEKLAEACAANPERFVAFATVALQYPDLAAEQLEEGVKKYGLRGACIGGSVNGAEISDPKFHPFWAKAEQLGVVVFIHPQGTGAPTDLQHRLKGSGYLENVIGNPLDHHRPLAPDLRGHARQIPRPEDLRGARRRLPAVVRRPLRSWMPDTARPLCRRNLRDDQEEAVGVSQAAVLRHDGVQARRGASPRRRGGRESAPGGHGLSVSVDEDRRGSHPRHPGGE